MGIRKRRTTQRCVQIYMPVLDCQTALQLASVGMVIPRKWVIPGINGGTACIFGCPRTIMMGQSFELLYPIHGEYERTNVCIIPVMNARSSYSDERIMKRASGESFWCHVTGRMLDRAKPLGEGIWTFEDLSAYCSAIAAPTSRKCDITAQPVEGKTSKQIGKQLEISPRTVGIYRVRLVRKYAVNTLLELIQRPMEY